MDYKGLVNYRFFTMADDSMEPVVEENNTVLVDTAAEIEDGDVVLAQLHNSVFMCRRVYRSEDGYLLRADNSPHDTPPDDVLCIIGKVVKVYKDI